uniref:hypothetical protein n=1 Tax=Candidatus Scatocola faecigallinarum TaxID=2840916 RepID=UPI0040261AE9
MTEQLAPNQKKIVDWDKKSDSDAERISKRLEGRSELDDRASTVNDVSSRPVAERTAAPVRPATRPAASRPAPAAGQPLQRLRQKIKEVYDDDDEDENAPGFFNISLLDEEETENGILPAGTVPDPARNESETLRITREQQLAGKLDAILSSSMAAREAGLSPRVSRADARLANSAEYDVKKIRRQTLKEKISEPLGLKGHLPEKDLGQALRGLKNAAETLEPSLHSAASQTPLSAAPLASLQRETSDILNGLPAETAPELAKEDDEKALARLILEKSGRGAPRKKLSEIAKGLKPFKKNENTADNGKENS